MSWQPVEFSIIKKFINEKVKNPDLVRGHLFSYLKLVQHGLSYSFTGATTKRSYHAFDKPLLFTRFKYFLSSLINPSRLPPISFRSIVVLDSKRIEESNGEVISVVFGKLIHAIGRDRITWVDSTGKLENIADAFLPTGSIVRGSLNKEERKVWCDLHFVYNRLKDSGTFTPDELHYIGAAFHVFFESFRKHFRLFHNKGIKTVLLSAHYHHEGIMAACKLLKIQTIEAQHGLIARQDLYYVYDEHWKPALKNALFADRILVFGEYWKEILTSGNEYQPENIIVAGDYMHRKKSVATSGNDGRTILVATQKMMGSIYVPYVQSLSERMLKFHPDWNIIVKIHPLEKDLNHYVDHLKISNVSIIAKEKTIDELLAICDIQISVYSTTLFEGLGTRAIGMVLLIDGPGIDYARDLVNQKIAIGITPDDDPVMIWSDLKNRSIIGFPKESAYADFRGDRLLSLVS